MILEFKGRDPGFFKIPTLHFFSHWIATSWGVNLHVYFDKDFWNVFITEPRIFGYPTYLIALAYLYLTLTAVFIIFYLLRNKQKKNYFISSKEIPLEHTKFYLYSLFYLAGFLFILSGTMVKAHYLQAFYPILFIIVSLFLLKHKKLFWSVAAAQLLISTVFILFIHVTGSFSTDGSNEMKVYGLQNYKPPCLEKICN